MKRVTNDTPKAGDPVTVLWSTRDWVDAILGLAADGPLPCRTVLVPRERVAHSLRRELLRKGRTDVLAGTRFMPLLGAATEVLRCAGVAFHANEGDLRTTRVHVLLCRGLPLRYFSAELLRSAPGWDEALAHTISDLEGAGLRPENLPALTSEPRWQDIATVWRALDESAPFSWTPSRIFVEAAALLETAPERWPFDGPVLAPVTGDISAAKTRFVRAIPHVTIGVIAGRPLREHYLKRLEALFGADVAAAIRASSAPRQTGSEQGLLASFLFERPDILADPARPRSDGPDGTVHLEEHSGIESELEGATDWVARQVIDAHTPLEEIAVLVPALDPVAGLLSERFQRLPWGDGRLPVHVAGGLPLVSFAAGARTLAVLRALREHLAADALADVLPALRTVDGDSRHLTRGAALDLAYSLGTIGGSSAKPEGALEWSLRAAERTTDLTAQLQRARQVQGDEEQAALARNAHDLERLLGDLQAIRPALEALVDVARLLVNHESLGTIWPALRAFLEQWLLHPGEGARVPALLDEVLRGACEDAICATLSGTDALDVIEEALRSLRLPSERFGHPAVYVGTVQEAAGLTFGAVRVIGLAEGALPAPPHDDPVLPERLRASVAGGVVLSAADRTLAQLHALDQVVRDAQGPLVLSAPRLTVERTERETSSIFIEAAAALGRPNSRTTRHDSVIPDAAALRRDAFEPARDSATAFRTRTPLSAAAWQDRVALLRRDLPSLWRGTPSLDLERIDLLTASGSWNGLDGNIGSDWLAPAMPGLTPERPISTSRLRQFLECPQRFLLQEVLSWREPASPPSLREIDPLPYGGLLHRVAEQFYRQHGEAFGQRKLTLQKWIAKADTLVDAAFDEFCHAYPLVGVAVRTQQLQRLRRDVRTFIEYDWDRAKARQFIAVERPFGQPDPVCLSLPQVSLYVRGFIDRIDVESGRTLIRDLKSGRPHPRQGEEAEPDHVLDLQIAVYGMVARQLATAWGIPAEVAAAYAYADWRGESERAFREDFPDLESAARAWLSTAALMLQGRLFPRTPVADDCRYCPFGPLCGPDVIERAARLLEGAAGPLGSFRSLKIGEDA